MDLYDPKKRLTWLSLTPKRNPKSTLQTTHSDISLSQISRTRDDSNT